MTAERGNSYMIDYLNSYSNDIWFIEIIQELKNYLIENTDVVDAMVACEILHKNIIRKFEVKKPQALTTKEIPFLELRGGRYVRVWKTVKI